ncbi:Trigger factor [Chlamydiales bacterium STE3]|nr:Trigger factor [Chlamydiales bacterium STE3]
MSNTVKNYENEHISLTVEHLDNCLVKLDIITQPLATEAAKTKAIKNITKEVNIPGFRKGKAPTQLISKQFSSSIEKETKEIILHNALDEAVKLCHIHPYSEKKGVKLIKFEPIQENSFEIVIEIEAFPEVPSVNVDELSLNKPQLKSVEDKDIEERIEELRIYHATWEEVDRPAAENDFVTIDFDVIDENPFTVYRDARFHLKEHKIPLWAKKLIIGQKTGAIVEGMSEQEEDSEKDFTPRKCRITIKKIEIATLPPVDDDLAKKAGVDTVEALQTSIRAHVEKDQEQKAQNELRKEMKKELANKYIFDLPLSRLEALKEECQELASQEHFRNEEDLKLFKEKLFEDGKETIRVSFLLPKLIREQNLPKPSPEKLRERIMSYMFNRYMEQGQKVDQKEIEYYAQVAENDLVVEGALDYLINQVTKENS